MGRVARTVFPFQPGLLDPDTIMNLIAGFMRPVQSEKCLSITSTELGPWHALPHCARLSQSWPHSGLDISDTISQIKS
jgi:hypothetical protein